MKSEKAKKQNEDKGYHKHLIKALGKAKSVQAEEQGDEITGPFEVVHQVT